MKFNRSKRSKRRGDYLFCILLALGCVQGFADNVVHFYLPTTRNLPVTNRYVLVTPLAIEPPANTLPVLDIIKYGPVTNEFWVTNMMAGTYQVEILAPPRSTVYAIYVDPTNTTQEAGAITVANARSTFPPGSVAWSASASDQRYSPIGTAGIAAATETNNSILARTNGVVVRFSVNLTNLTNTAASVGGGSPIASVDFPYQGYIWQFQRRPWRGIGQPGGAAGVPNNHSGLIPLDAAGSNTIGNYGILGCITNLASFPDAKACGYEWVDVDDGWTIRGARNESTLQTADSARFTNSMSVLTDAAHTNGLKLSIYTAFGATTDGGGQGSTTNTIYADVLQYMAWGFDGMIVDNSVQSGANPPGFYGTNGLGLKIFLRRANQAIADFNSQVTNSAVAASPQILSYKPFTIQVVNQSGSGSGGTAFGTPEVSMLANSTWYRGVSHGRLTEAVPDFEALLNFRYATGPGHFGPMINFPQPGGAGQNDGCQHFQAYLNMASMGANSLTATYLGDANFARVVMPCYTNRDFYDVYDDPKFETGRQVYSNNLCRVWVRELSGVDRHDLVLLNQNTNTIVWSGLGSFNALNCAGSVDYSALEVPFSQDTSKGIAYYTNGAHTAVTYFRSGASDPADPDQGNSNFWYLTNVANGLILHNNYGGGSDLPPTNHWGHCTADHGTAKAMYASNSIPITAAMLGASSNVAYALYDVWTHTKLGVFTGGTNIQLQGNSSLKLVAYPESSGPPKQYVGSFVGDGSGLTNLSSVSGTGIATNSGTGTNNVLTSTILRGNTDLTALYFGGGDVRMTNGTFAGDVALRLYDRTYGTSSFWSNGVWSGRFAGDGSGLTNISGTTALGYQTNQITTNSNAGVSNKLSQVAGSVINGYATNSYGAGPYGFSLNLGNLPNFQKALTNNNSNIRLAWIGDSTGADTLQGIYNLFSTNYSLGISALPELTGVSAYFPGNGNGFAQDASGSQSDTAWWGQSFVLSNNVAFTGSNTVTFGIRNSYPVTANSLRFWYFAKSTRGTALLQTSPSSASNTWTTVATVDTSTGTVGLRVTNVSLSAGSYYVRITNSVPGTESRVVFLWPQLRNTATNSVEVMDAHVSGQTLAGFMAMGTNNIATLLTNFNPTVIFYQQKKPPAGMDYWTNVAVMFKTYATNSDVVVIQSYEGGDTATAADPANGVQFQLPVQRDVAKSNNWAFVDFYTPISWTNVVERFGFNNGSDAIHLNAAGGLYLAGMLAQQLDLKGYLINAGKFVLPAATVSINPIYNTTNIGPFTVQSSNVNFAAFDSFGSTAMALWLGRLEGTAGPWTFAADRSGNSYFRGTNFINFCGFSTAGGYNEGGSMWASGGWSFMNMASDALRTTDPGVGNVIVGGTLRSGRLGIGVAAPSAGVKITNTVDTTSAIVTVQGTNNISDVIGPGGGLSIGTTTFAGPGSILATNTITASGSTGFLGEGSGVTNVWVKQLFKGGMYFSTLTTGSQFTPVDVDSATAIGAALGRQTLSPVGGYLTNFQVWSSVSWPATTNCVFTVSTNKGLSTVVATPITCTLVPSASGVYTNSGTTSLQLPTIQDPTGYTWSLNVNATAPSGNPTSQSIHWSIEWWHQ